MKPSAKFLIVFNVVMNLPIAVALAVTATLMTGGPAAFGTAQPYLMCLLGFVIACIVAAVVPVNKINMGFPKLFKLDPEKIGGRLVANIPVALIFTAVILAVMIVLNVGPAVHYAMGPMVGAFFGMLLPLTVVAYIVSMIFAPIAVKAAMSADGKKQAA